MKYLEPNNHTSHDLGSGANDPHKLEALTPHHSSESMRDKSRSWIYEVLVIPHATDTQRTFSCYQDKRDKSALESPKQ
jgi:hypothetical protein